MQNVKSLSALKGARILIVEDEPLVADFLEERLRMEGCEVIGPAREVHTALAIIERERADAAILDLDLHGERATSVAEALAARRIPFVIVSGYGVQQSIDEPVLQQAPRLGKPFRTRQLLRMLAQTLAAGG